MADLAQPASVPLLRLPGRRSWYLQAAVPEPLQELLGCTVVHAALDTDSRDEALRRRDSMLGRITAGFEGLLARLPDGAADAGPGPAPADLAAFLDELRRLEADGVAVAGPAGDAAAMAADRTFSHDEDLLNQIGLAEAGAQDTPPHRTMVAEAFLAEHPLTESIDVILPDLAGIIRGKRLPPKDFVSACRDGTYFTTGLYGLDSTGTNVGEIALVWQDGEADRPTRLDLGTLRPVPWRAGGAQIIADMRDHDGSPFFANPRQILADVAARFARLGLRAVAALELEFYLVDMESDPQGRPLLANCARLGRRPQEIEVFALERYEDQEAFLELVDRYAAAQELPVKGSVSEYAPCQFEINLGHVDDMVRAADHALMLKRCIKAAARATGQRATFMAKPFEEQSGSGLHVHLSLLDRDGRNLFGETAEGGTRLRHAVWGLQQLMAEAMLIFAPNANSYRRLRPLSYAPTAASWGENNRTVAVRIPPGPAGARRVEHRVAGADANPYLVLAAVLAGVLHGLEHGGEPTQPIRGNAYGQVPADLPLTWEEAIAACRRGQRLGTYLDDRFLALYTACREGERNRFHGRITPTEYAWYLTSV